MVCKLLNSLGLTVCFGEIACAKTNFCFSVTIQLSETDYTPGPPHLPASPTSFCPGGLANLLNRPPMSNFFFDSLSSLASFFSTRERTQIPDAAEGFFPSPTSDLGAAASSPFLPALQTGRRFVLQPVVSVQSRVEKKRKRSVGSRNPLKIRLVTKERQLPWRGT